MRWGWRSLIAAGRGAAASEAEAAARADAAAGATEAGLPVADWRRMSPLELTIAPQPVLIGGPLLRAPDISGTRSLIQRPGGQAAGPVGDSATVPAGGHVGGIVVPQPPPPATGADAARQRARDRAARGHRQADLPQAGQVRGPLAQAKLRPAVRATAGERPSLVRATSEYVGDPRADETPYASSAWLRMVQAYRQLPAEEPAASLALPGLTESTTEDGGTVLSWSSATAFAPPHAAPPAPPRQGRGRTCPSGGPASPRAAASESVARWHARPSPATRPKLTPRQPRRVCRSRGVERTRPAPRRLAPRRPVPRRPVPRRPVPCRLAPRKLKQGRRPPLRLSRQPGRRPLPSPPRGPGRRHRLVSAWARRSPCAASRSRGRPTIRARSSVHGRALAPALGLTRPEERGTTGLNLSAPRI